MGNKIKSASCFVLSFLCAAFSLTSEQNDRETSQNDSLIESSFDFREFVFREGLALSPNGQWIAYSVRQKPFEDDLNKLNTIQGTPVYSIGSHIYISDLKGNTKKLGIAGNSWRPVWSPDSSQIAFYSDYLADNIHTPLLLIHGEPPNESMKLFTALNRLHRPAELVLYPKEGHVLGDWSQPNAVDATRRILNFLDYYLITNRSTIN